MFKRLFFLLLCLSFFISQNAVAQEVFKIGAPLPMTGAGAAFGEKFKKAYTMAIEEINAKGGVNGKKLELVIDDTQAKPATAVTNAKKLITSDKVVALIGGWSSGVALAVAPVAQENKTPYILEHPALDDITKQGHDYVFRLQPTTGMYSAALEDFLEKVVYPKEKKKLKVAYLYVDNAFGQGVAKNGILPFFQSKKDKFELVISDAYNEKALDYKPLLIKVKNANPDIVILTSYLTDGILLAKQTKEIGLKAKLFSGTGAGHSMQDIYEKSGGAVEGYFTSGPWHGEINSPQWKKWRQEWENRFKYVPGEHEIEGYVAIYVLAEGLKNVKSKDITKQREELQQGLKAVNMNTIFGKVKFENFNGYTNQNKAHSLTALAQWQNGKLLQVWPKSAAEADYKY
ncbi:MAG: ABC transporter substrate-binding protein [Thermodesulfovibrionales bacterium]